MKSSPKWIDDLPKSGHYCHFRLDQDKWIRCEIVQTSAGVSILPYDLVGSAWTQSARRGNMSGQWHSYLQNLRSRKTYAFPPLSTIYESPVYQYRHEATDPFLEKAHRVYMFFPKISDQVRAHIAKLQPIETAQMSWQETSTEIATTSPAPLTRSQKKYALVPLDYEEKIQKASGKDYWLQKAHAHPECALVALGLVSVNVLAWALFLPLGIVATLATLCAMFAGYHVSKPKTVPELKTLPALKAYVAENNILDATDPWLVANWEMTSKALASLDGVPVVTGQDYRSVLELSRQRINCHVALSYAKLVDGELDTKKEQEELSQKEKALETMLENTQQSLARAHLQLLMYGTQTTTGVHAEENAADIAASVKDAYTVE